MSESVSTRFPFLAGLALSVLLITLSSGCRPSATRVFEDGQKLVEAGRYEEAIEKLNEARATFDEDPVLWSLMGLALHRTGQLEPAETAYHRATTLAERSDLPLPDIHTKLAELYIDRGRPSLAIPLLEERLRIDSSSVDSLLLLGVAYRTQLSNATTVSERQELLRKGEEILAEGANAARSSRDEIFHQLALLYLEAKDTRKALEYAQRAVSADSENERAWWSYANLSHLNLQSATAQPQAVQAVIERYQRYIEISVDNERRQKAETALATLRGDISPPPAATDTNEEVEEPEEEGAVAVTVTNTPPTAPAVEIDEVVDETPVEVTETSEPEVDDAPETEVEEDSGSEVEIAGGAEATIEIEQPEPESDLGQASESTETSGTTAEPVGHEQSFAGGSDPGLEVEDTASESEEVTQEPAVATTTTEEETETEEPATAIAVPGETTLEATETTEPSPPIVASSPEEGDNSGVLPEVDPGDRRRVAYEAFRLGAAEQREGDYSNAIRHYSDALRYDPNFYECLFNRAYCYFRQNRYADAAESYRRALQARPGATNTRRNYAITLVRLNRYSDAMAQVNAWIQQEPRSPEAHLLGAKLAADKLKDNQLARYHYGVFLNLNPASPDAPAIRNWLEREYTARQP